MAKQLVEPFRVEPDDDLAVHYHRRRGSALIRVHKFLHCRGIAAHVAYFVLDSLVVKVLFKRVTGWACRLGENNDLLRCAQACFPEEDSTRLTCIFDFINNLRGFV